MANNSAGQVTGQQSSAQETAHRATSKAASTAHEMVDKAAATAERLEDKARTTADNLHARSHEAMEKAKQQSGELTSTLRTYTHNHPIASLGIAFTAGILLAALMRR